MKLTKKILLPFTALFSLFMFSCKTYYISPESFKQQFAGIDSTKLKEVTVKGPGFATWHYKANPLTKIKCTDKQNNPAELTNSPSIEIRFTYGYRKKRTIFYFDRIFVSSNTVVGVQSRFAGFLRKTIPIDSITRIEVQDGHKDFRYVNP